MNKLELAKLKRKARVLADDFKDSAKEYLINPDIDNLETLQANAIAYQGVFYALTQDSTVISN